MKTLAAIFALAVLGQPFVAMATDYTAPRTWRSEDGRPLEAKLIRLSAETQSVELERDDGQRFTLPWSRFSEEDQTFLQAAAAASSSAHESATPNTTAAETLAPLPESVRLKDVPMIRQKGNYCVPASAAMIANFHGIETDQDQVAELSSAMSASNQGTYPADMLLAMEKLGFDGRSLYWKGDDDFYENALPQIRRALFDAGPIYISFRPNVFGSMGHGCVIVGYDDRKQELYFHNPWGNTFEKTYEAVASESGGVVIIEAPTPAPVATEAFVAHIQTLVPRFEGDFLALAGRLKDADAAHEFVWCSRRDAREDKRFARDTARDNGRQILELAFERNPAVFIPYSDDGSTREYLFVTRPPEGGARFLVRRIGTDGWAEPALETLGQLTRYWPTAFSQKDKAEKIWELPMIELHPVPGL